MRLGRGPREVYRVYGEDEAPAVDEWGAKAPTQEFAVPSDEPAPVPRSAPHARLGQLRRVAVMTLLGVGVGLVAALALHSLRAPAGGDGRRAGWAGPSGAALLPSTSPSVPVAAVPAEAQAQAQRTVRATPVHVAAVRAPRSHPRVQGESGMRRESARNREHGAYGESAARHAASAAHIAAYPAVHSAAATPSQSTAEAQPPVEAAQSEFTFER